MLWLDLSSQLYTHTCHTRVHTHTHGSLEWDEGPWNVAGVCSHLLQGPRNASLQK